MITDPEIAFAIKIDRLRRAALRHRQERNFLHWLFWFGVIAACGFGAVEAVSVIAEFI